MPLGLARIPSFAAPNRESLTPLTGPGFAVFSAPEASALATGFTVRCWGFGFWAGAGKLVDISSNISAGPREEGQQQGWGFEFRISFFCFRASQEVWVYGFPFRGL